MREKLKEVTLSLHWACITGNVGLVKFALDHGVPVDSTVNGFVPLQLACISDNNIAVVQYLIDRGADVNIQKWSKKHSTDKTQAVHGATGSTALHVACANGCTKIVDLLIRNNALTDVKDKYGSTPFDVAQAKNETEIVKLLLRAKGERKSRKSQDVIERKSLELPILTHRRTTSDKAIRARRPSMPSIFEKNNSENLFFPPPSSSSPPPPPVPAFISMTPAISPEPNSRRSFTSTHRPFNEEMHPIHVSSSPSDIPKDTSEQPKNYRRHKRERSNYSTEDLLNLASCSSTNKGILSDCSSSVNTMDSHPDWYSYGIVRPYHEDSYLQSLERRAFNLESTESSYSTKASQEGLSKLMDRLYSSSEYSTTDQLAGDKSSSLGSKEGGLRRVMSSGGESVSDLGEDGYDGEEEEESESYALPQMPKDRKGSDLVGYRPKKALPLEPMTTAETKRGWLNNFNPYSHDHRFSLDHLSHFKRKSHPVKQYNDFSSDEDEKQFCQPQQRAGFISRWTPSWPKK